MHCPGLKAPGNAQTVIELRLVAATTEQQGSPRGQDPVGLDHMSLSKSLFDKLCIIRGENPPGNAETVIKKGIALFRFPGRMAPGNGDGCGIT